MSRSSTGPSASPPARPVQLRLWRGAGTALVVILSVLVSDAVSRLRSTDTRLSLGYDLLPSYTAGRLVREGHAERLYDSPAFQAAEAQVIREANLRADARYAPWLNPPFYAWTFAPLSALPYRAAAAVGLAASLGLAAGSVVLLVRMLPSGIGWKTWGLVPACMIASAPFWEILVSLQNTFLSLLLLCGTVTFWRRGQGLRAGLLAGLLLFKPQLAAVVAVVLVASLGRRAAVGVFFTCTAMLLLNATLPGSLAGFIHGVPPIVRHLQEQSRYNWGRQATFQGFWRLALQGHGRGATAGTVKLLAAASSAGVLIALGLVALHVWMDQSPESRGVSPRTGPRPDSTAPCRHDRLIAAAVLCMPLLMPYYMEYDLLLLAVPAVLLAAERLQPADHSAVHDRWLVRAWVALFIGVTANPLVAGITRLNLVVPLLAMLTALSLGRCLRNGPAVGKIPPQTETEAGQGEVGGSETTARAA